MPCPLLCTRMRQYHSKVSWQSVASLNSRLNSWFLIPVWIENKLLRNESRIESREGCSGLLSRNATERNIKNQDATIEESSLDSWLDSWFSWGLRIKCVALLLKGTVIIFDFYSLNQTFALTTFKHFDLLKCKFIPNEGRSCHWEWYPENVQLTSDKPVECPFHYTVTGAVLCIFFCTDML